MDLFRNRRNFGNCLGGRDEVQPRLYQLVLHGITIVGLVFSFVFLALATKHLPLSLSYPVWTGIGAVGSIIAGVILFHDKIAPVTWMFIVMLVIGLIGIKVTS